MDHRKEIQLEMPGVSSVDEVIKTWMEAFVSDPEYKNHKGHYAIFDGKTGTHLGYRSVSRENGDDRFSEGNSWNQEEIPIGARIEKIK